MKVRFDLKNLQFAFIFLGAIVVFAIIFSVLNTNTGTNNSSGRSDTECFMIAQVDAKEFATEINSDENAFILDVRTAEEYTLGRIAGAENIDYYSSDFKERLSGLDRNLNYKIYCNSGNRSASTLQIMKELGFKNITELNGGIQAWNRVGQQSCTNC